MDEPQRSFTGVCPQHGIQHISEPIEALLERDALREALTELSGYVRAHLAGQDADPELKWALAESVAALEHPE